MNRTARTFFYCSIVVLWLFVLVAGLELWSRMQWRATEKNNPYLLSREERHPWPAKDPHSDTVSPFLVDKETRQRYRGRGKSVARLSQPTDKEELLRRVAFFHDYEAPQRYLLANVFALHVFLLQSDGSLTASYSLQNYEGDKKLTDIVGEQDAHLLITALADAAEWGSPYRFVDGASSEEFGDLWYLLAIPEDGWQPGSENEEAWLFFARRDAIADLPPDSPWELPFMTYRKHLERHGREGFRGIKQDYYINNFGFRDWDIIVPKPEGVFRALCIGASTTEEGMVNELTYPAILETLINRHFDDNFVDVINCGVSGTNSMKHRMLLPDYLALDPDLLIIYNATNDICHQLLPRWMNEATPRQQQLRRSQFIVRHKNHLLLPSEEEMRRDIEIHHVPDLRYIIHEARKRGVTTAISSFAAPDRQRLSADEYAYYNYLTMTEWGGRYVSFDSYLRILNLYNDALRRLCEEEDILYIPVAERLRGGAALFYDICHLRSPGIEHKATIIAEALIPHIRTAFIDR